MDDAEALVWRGITASNPWWVTGEVPAPRTRRFHRHAFGAIYERLRGATQGRGLVVLGPRRVGKTILLHQVAAELLASGVEPARVVLLSLDDVALRGADLGDLLALVERRKPVSALAPRFLLLDEVQHSESWAGWLKRLTDRRDPYVFLATGSSATALRRGGQDQGLGRWQEMVLYPWSFREHASFRNRGHWTFRYFDELGARMDAGQPVRDSAAEALLEVGPRPEDEDDRLDGELLDYLVRGGFPEVLERDDVREAQRHLRQDILDRSLGRELLDVVGVDARAIERLFLRVCRNPGGLWNASQVSKELELSRPTVNRYLELLERAFLLFSLPNLASPVKGLSKVYLVAPALRSALLGLDEEAVREPGEWGRMVENLVAATAMGAYRDALQVGFWRRDEDECDLVVQSRDGDSEYIEVKRSGHKARRGLIKAAQSLASPGRGFVLERRVPGPAPGVGTDLQTGPPPLEWIAQFSVVEWLYWNRAHEGGTLRIVAP